MTKILLTFLISAAMTVAIAYFSGVIRGETGVELLEVENNYWELTATVKNNGDSNATIVAYELLNKADNGTGQWNRVSLSDLNIKLKPGEEQRISLPDKTISENFMVRLFVMNNTGGQYSIDKENID